MERLLCILLISVCFSFCMSNHRPVANLADLFRYEPTSAGNVTGQPVPGRYLGYLLLKERSLKVPMSIDVVAMRTSSRKWDYKLFSKLFLGGFSAPEFHTYVLEGVSFTDGVAAYGNVGAVDAISLKDLHLKGGSVLTGNAFEAGVDLGKFVTLYVGKRKKINAYEMVEKIFPETPLVPGLRGSYAGQCKDKVKKLEISTSRWTKSGEAPKLLDTHRLFARWGVVEPILCGEKGFSCLKKTYNHFNYGLASGDLLLRGIDGELACKVSGSGLRCGECELSNLDQTDPEIENKRGLTQLVERPERSDRLFIPGDVGVGEAMSGEFYGYLYNETTLKQQFVRVKMEFSYNQVTNEPNLAGLVTLFFGEKNSREFIVNRFSTVVPFKRASGVILSGLGDVVLQVSRWSKAGMRAIWYSKSFGRVGTLEAKRSEIPDRDQSILTMGAIGGSYRSQQRRFDLVAQADVSRSDKSFFPMGVRGVVRGLQNTSSIGVIKELSYDYYSGQVGILLDDFRLLVGEGTANGFNVRWREDDRFGAAMVDVPVESFRYEDDQTNGKTAKQVLEILNYGKL